MKVTFSTRPLCAPLFQSIAPPLVPAIFLINSELVKLVLVQFSRPLACKYTAPPRLAASLSSNVQLSTSPSEPIQITAPPSPP